MLFPATSAILSHLPSPTCILRYAFWFNLVSDYTDSSRSSPLYLPSPTAESYLGKNSLSAQEMFSISEKLIEQYIAILVSAVEYSHASVQSETFEVCLK